ncbi:PDDEXK family nuclease [Arabiibacter massiliensis]|uniref:hypothetical protein n=1 Tax=Arabiibacter massiliensis TaxID=1870985 RepID=UPI00155AD002|nr:hypothetical protein [Arabiibacter massiliensis]
MSIFIGYESALECLRAEGFPERAVACRANPHAGRVPTGKDVRAADLDAAGVNGRPLALVVPDAASRGKSQGLECHVWNAPVGTQSFVRVGEGLFASRTEACFLQMATRLSSVQLILLGYELCGTYVLDASHPNGFRKREKPLTSAAALRRYVQKAAGMKGSRQALEALRFVADGSASPMESVLTMLLCLSTVLGGYGLALPLLNYLVRMPDDVRRATGRARCFCDLCWPEAKLAVEYESDAFHGGETDIARDSKRRAALARAGYTVVTVTWAQVRDARELDEVARVLAKRLGKRLRISRADWMSRRFELRNAIMPQKSALENRTGDVLS